VNRRRAALSVVAMKSAVRPLRFAALAIALLVALLWWCWHLATRPQPERLEARHGNVIETQLTDTTYTRQGARVEAIRLQTDTGLFVDLRVLRQVDEHSHPRPTVLLLGGHRTGRDAVKLVGEPGELVIVALDYPYSGPERIRGWRAGLAAVPLIRQALLDTPVAVSVALDWLATQPWVDTGHVELAGVSLGVPFAAAAGARDERFRRVWLIHGAADNRAWLANNLASRLGWAPVRFVVSHTLIRFAHGATLDTTRNAARIGPRELVVVQAREDASVPADSADRLAAAASGPVTILWTDGGHVHPREPETVRRLVELVREVITASASAQPPATSPTASKTP
jgi:hypothetical protein